MKSGSRRGPVEPGIEILVGDQGPGLAEGDTERIFDAFHSSKPAGMGIGLAVSRSIVEAHGGRLWAEPGTGHGAIFHLELPVTRVMNEPTPIVFVVDDDPSIRTAVARLLGSVGLRAEGYPSAEAVLDRLTSNDAGCVVLDIRMPGPSGLDLQASLGGQGRPPAHPLPDRARRRADHGARDEGRRA